MRTYDDFSGSQPADDEPRMLARAPRMRLDEDDKRIATLSTHGDHKIWEATSYISFTKSPGKLRELAQMRAMKKRGEQKIVVVDPRTRFELGLPILHYGKE